MRKDAKVRKAATSHTMKTHHYYKCVSAKHRKGCNKKTVKKDWIEDLIIEKIIELLFDDKMIDNIANSVIELQSRENVNLPFLKRQLAETEKSIQNMLNAIQQGILTTSTKERLDQLEETKSQLEENILQEEMQKPLLTKEQVLFWLCKFREVDVKDAIQRQRLIDGFVNAIYLYDDKMILTFNYKDGSKTVSFEEVNSSYLFALGACKPSKICSVLSQSFINKRSIFDMRAWWNGRHVGLRSRSARVQVQVLSPALRV